MKTKQASHLHLSVERSETRKAKPTSLLKVQRRASELLVELSAFDELVDDFLTASGLASSRFGRDALNMADFTRWLRDGRQFRIDTVSKALNYIATFKT